MANVLRWMSLYSDEGARSADFRAKAEDHSKGVLEDLPKEGSPEANSHAALIAKASVLRLKGNLIYDIITKSGLRNAKLSELDSAISFYELATTVGKTLISQLTGEHTGEETFILGSQLFTLANLADCYHYKLAKLENTGKNAETAVLKTALKRVLDERITLGKELIALGGANRYFTTLLAFGYYNMAKKAALDKIPGISQEEAFNDLRFAFCLTLLDPQDEITNYFSDEIRKRNPKNPQAAKSIKDIVMFFKALNAEISHFTTGGTQSNVQ